MEIADTMNPIDRFQQSQTVVTSKDTEAGGGLNLAIKRAKPKLAGPSSPAEESDKKKTEKKVEEKKNQNNQQHGTSQTATAADPEQEQSTSKSGKLDHKTQTRWKLSCFSSRPSKHIYIGRTRSKHRVFGRSG